MYTQNETSRCFQMPTDPDRLLRDNGISGNSFLSVSFIKRPRSKGSRDKDAISRTTLSGNAVCTVTRTFNKFPIEVELKVRYNKIHGAGRGGEEESISSSSFEFVFKRSLLQIVWDK